MSNFDKGKSFEQKVAGMIRKKADLMAKRNPGSHANWHRSSDVFTDLPIHVECKDQETVKIKEWYEQAEAAASFNETPTVVFHKDEEILVCLRFNDLLDLYAQIADNQVEIEDLRKPIEMQVNNTPVTIRKEVVETEGEKIVTPVVEQKVDRGSKTCRAGHLSDDFGYCMQVTCPYSRGYRKPKKKAGKP